MTELQKKEFEILKSFIEICEKLELEYFLVCGSALGAVKYEGFIPWDDDIDVAMLREDYARFIKEAPALLPEDLFLQNFRSEENFPAIYTKLRNSKTTFIEKSARFLPINHGIFIDIFPLDGYPEGEFEGKTLEIKKKIYKLVTGSVYDFPENKKHRAIKTACRLLGLDKNISGIAEKYEKLISGYPVKGSKLICNHGNWQGKLEYAPSEQYGKGAKAVFEGITVTVPEKFDEYLTQKYGNWRADLPEDEKKGHHYYEICDTEKSYTEYMKQ